MNVPVCQMLYLSNDVTRIKKHFLGAKRRRISKQRPLANPLKVGVALRLFLHVLYTVFLIKLSGDVEINPGPIQEENAKRSIKCVTLNVRSLTSSVKTKNRIESNHERFQNFVYSEDFDIVCVNETWLTENVYNAEILHSGYSVIRNDRKSRGGGVLLGIKTDIFKDVRTLEHNYKLEMSVAEIVTSTDMKFLICSCYRPPDADNTWMETFEMFLRDMCTRYSEIVITGDFNLPRACWNWQVDTSVGNEHAFVSLLNDFF